jgi:isocitrate dehydrogenase kinase/phosphatase
MWIPSRHHRLAKRGAAAIVRILDEYKLQFQAITLRAPLRFERGNWHALQRDAAERLELYSRVIVGLVSEVRTLLGASVKDKKLWSVMKLDYSELIAGRADVELAETFFNSATRRIFATVGVDPKIEFLFSDFDIPLRTGDCPYHSYLPDNGLVVVIRQLLTTYAFSIPFEDLEGDARRAARAIECERLRLGITRPVDGIDMIRSVFYRTKGAYLVGRIRSDDHAMPLTLALHRRDQGLYVDAALLTEDEVSIIFSFTRAYFHVEVDRPHDLIAFLKSIMPRKPVAELYNAIGYDHHGKTELFRDLMGHIQGSTDQFEVARGDRGMVMIVFALSSFVVVFKVIRDTFAYPKTVTRRDVIDRYKFVFMHDRAGRLADVQEFEHLAFPRSRFSDQLLTELASGAAESVTIGEHMVEIKHLYTQRRLMPLNLYVREVDRTTACDAVIDYGQAVKDLAVTNIFPGDMLLKNFGVTRHGRVVFYDYDELCPVTDCTFRELPQARTFDEEFGAEPWFYVGPRDVFPEEFITFMGLAGQLREAFLTAHGDLLTTRYWTDIQTRHRAGEVLDIIPYRSSRRLRVEEPASPELSGS